MKNIIKKLSLALCLLVLPLCQLSAQVGRIWECDYRQYEMDMPVYVTITNMGSPIENVNNFQVGAFVGDECRGVATAPMVYGSPSCYMLRTWANTDGEKLTFRLYSLKSKKEYTCSVSDSIIFQAQRIKGSVSNPIVLDVELEAEDMPIEWTYTDDDELYLYNAEADAFLVGANEWSTRASVGEQGYKVKLHNIDNNGVFTIENYGLNGQGTWKWQYMFAETSKNIFVDRNGQADFYWDVILTGKNTVRITYSQVYNPNVNSTLFGGEEVYLGWNRNSDDSRVYFLTPEEGAVEWQILTEEEYRAMQAKTVELPEGWENASDENPVSFTSIITNPEFDNNDLTGWSGTILGAVNGNSNAEHYQKTYDTYQSFTGLPAGIYRVNLKAFYRAGQYYNDAEYYFYGDDYGYDPSEYQLAKLYATSGMGDFEIPICQPSSEASYERLGGSESLINDYDGNTCYIPNDMLAGSIYFAAGKYNNGMYVEVGEDGVLTIGFRKDEVLTGDWTLVDGWMLTYYGKDSKHYSGEDARMELYANDLKNALNQLQQVIDDADTTVVNAAMLNESQEFVNGVNEELESNSLSLKEIQDAITQAHYYLSEVGRIAVEVEVKNAGTLSECIMKQTEYTDLIVSLTIKGELNDIDLQYLKSLNKLETLDMAGVSNLGTIPSDFMYDNDHIQRVVIPEGVREIGVYAFYSCDNLRSLDLPSTLNLLNTYAIGYCYNLETVNVRSFMPPHLTSGSLNSYNYCEVYVPEESYDLYMNDWHWSDYVGINVLPGYSPQTIYVHNDLTYSPKEGEKKNVILTSADYPDDDNSTLNFGTLTIAPETGEAKLGNFEMVYDPNTVYWSGYNDVYPRMNSLITQGNVSAENIKLMVYIDSRQWSFLSLPFDVKISDIKSNQAGNAPWIIREYDGEARAQQGVTSQGSWKNLSINDTLKAGKGYIWLSDVRYPTESSWYAWNGFDVPAALDNQQQIFTNEDIELPLQKHSSANYADADWNLIGNPYPAYYDIRYTDISSPVTVWRKQNGMGGWYEAYSPMDDEYILMPGEAFFVQNNGQETVTFSQDGRQHSPSVMSRNYAKARAKAVSADRALVNLIIQQDGEQVDRTRVVLNPEASMDYEQACDAAKFSTNGRTQFYTMHEGVRYAINERPMEQGVVMLGADFAAAGEYGISLASVRNFDKKVFLEDKLTGEIVELTEDATYSFNAEAGSCVGRFFLHIADDPTCINQVDAQMANAGAVYNLQGVRQSANVSKGIYIMGNRKVVVK